MKFLEILLGFLASEGKSFVKSNTDAVTQQIANNGRRIALLLSLTAISISLFCMGFGMAFKTIVDHFQNSSTFDSGPSLMSGISLAVISSLGLVYSLGEGRWMKAVGAQDRPPSNNSTNSTEPALQTAIAMLIVEVSQQLKHSRQHEATRPQESKGSDSL